MRDKAHEFHRRQAQVLIVEPKEAYQIRYLLRYAKRNRNDYRTRPIDKFRGETVPRWLTESGDLVWPIVSDPASTLGATYGLAFQIVSADSLGQHCNRPATFVIDREGVIRFEHRVMRENDAHPTADELLQTIDDLEERHTLIAGLKKKGGSLGDAAATVLEPIGSASATAVPALVAALEHDDAVVRAAAAAGLCWIAPHAKTAISALRAALADPDARVRRLSAETLWRIGPDAKPADRALIQSLKDEDAAVRSMAATALERMGGVVLPSLIESLEHDDPIIRAAVAGLLWRFDPPPDRVVGALSSLLLRDGHAQVREAAAYALRDLHYYDTALLDALRDEDARVRLAAADSLWRVDVPPSQIRALVLALSAALKDEDSGVRGQASYDLYRLARDSDDAKLALPALVGTLTDESLTARRYAIEALLGIGAFDDDRLITTFIDLLKDVEPVVRLLAAHALARIADAGYDAKSAVPALIQVLGDKNTDVRKAAAKCLATIGPDARAAIPRLIELLEDEDDDVRQVVSEALARINNNVQ